MRITIRKAQKSDCSRMLELIQELADYERAPEEVTINPRHFADSGFGKNPVWWALVAEVDAKVVGFALYYIRFSTWKGQRLYLEDLIVTESMRGKGIGKRLFDGLINEGKEKKLDGMNWQVLEWNTPAKNFYMMYDAVLDPEWMNGSIDW